jgi:hypothetical protein
MTNTAGSGGEDMRNMRVLVFALLVLGMVVQLVLFYQFTGKARDRASPFSLEVDPTYLPDGAAGQTSTLSATIVDEGPGDHEGEAVELSVIAPGAEVTVTPASIAPGEVARISVTPGEGSAGGNLTVTIIGKRTRKEKATATIVVNPL